MNQLITADCLDRLPYIPGKSIDLVFADPPFNIGYDYGDEYDDNRTAPEYANWSRKWIRGVRRVLKPHGTFWLAIGDEWVADLRIFAREEGFHLRSWVIWYYTFGVNSPKKLSRSHTHLLYFTRQRSRFTFNEQEVRVPSARATVYNDKRANPDGRLPDDTWILRPQEIPEGFPPRFDTWYFPRIAGTFKRRHAGAANQMPEQLLGRIIRMCSNEGDLVLDPFVGTGTTLAVAKKLGRQYLGYEISASFADTARKRIKKAKEGDPLDTPLKEN